MSTPGLPSPIYSQNAASSTSTGSTIDCTAFTEDSSCLIVITGTATVQLQGNLDSTNSATWVDCSQGGYTSSVWVTIPFRCAYMRTVVTAYSSGTVTSIFSRGISDNNKSIVSGQNPQTFTTGAQ